MSRAQGRAQYKGFNFHLHVTVSEAQRLKVIRLARGQHLGVSEYMRTVIDGLGLEVAP